MTDTKTNEAREAAALKERVAEDYFGSLLVKARVAAAKASVKFPQPNYVTLKIAEEAGEVVRGAVHYAEGRMAWSEVEGEIVQLLAMLIRFVTEGDQINGITPPITEWASNVRYVPADLLADMTRQRDEARAEGFAAGLIAAIKLCDGIAGNTADFSRDHRRAAGQCGAAIRALAEGAKP